MPDTNTAVALFPGQGSQEPGMGRDAAEASRDVMELWKKAEQYSNADLRGIYWEGDAETMARTRYLQPALTVVNCSVWMAARDSLGPLCAAGHSLGEYAALAASGTLSMEETLEAVALRGRLMEEADPDGRGAMAAVLKLDLDTVQSIVDDAAEQTGAVILVANHNTPAQYVISGEKAAIDAAGELVKNHKARFVPLPVSGAFHSPLMAEAAAELAGQLDKLHWNKPAFPVICNVTAQAESDPDALRDIMKRQMISSVRWIDSMRAAWDLGGRRFLELGPKGVLTRMLNAILKEQAGADGSLEALNISSWQDAQTLV